MGTQVVCTICPTANGHLIKPSDGGRLAMKAGAPAAPAAAAHSTGAVKK